jgi:hypothetical protein
VDRSVAELVVEISSSKPCNECGEDPLRIIRCFLQHMISRPVNDCCVSTHHDRIVESSARAMTSEFGIKRWPCLLPNSISSHHQLFNHHNLDFSSLHSLFIQITFICYQHHSRFYHNEVLNTLSCCPRCRQQRRYRPAGSSHLLCSCT